MTPSDSGEREVPCEHGFNGPCPAPPRRKPPDGIRIPSSLAQRILAALEAVDGGMNMGCASLAAELRAVIPK